jgi:hypothetical protein
VPEKVFLVWVSIGGCYKLLSKVKIPAISIENKIGIQILPTFAAPQ